MSHSRRFNETFGNRSNVGNDSSMNPLMIESPVARDRFSRFSRLTDTFNQSKLSHSMLGISQGSLLNETSSMFNQTGTELGNVSDVSSVVNLSSVFNMNPTLNENVPDDSENDDEMARLAIFQSFFELNQQHQKPLETFELIDQFDQTCEENLLVHKEMLESKVRSDNEAAYLSKFSSLIRLERNTWRLVRALYADRLQNQAAQDKLNLSSEVENMDLEEDLRLRLSDMELVERAMERNAMLREMQIVIDWLESVYDDEATDKVQFYSDGPMYWENTLHALKVASRSQGTPLGLSKGRQFCNQMDPDSSIRTGMPVHDLDKEDENRLFHHIYKLIRAGNLQQGKEIAERLGYFWLSAALEGWILHHDPNFNPESTSEDNENNLSLGSPSRFSVATDASGTTTAAVKVLQSIIGNPYRDLWKHTAWKCSKMEGTNLYERAIFAIFSGNRSVIMPLCTKWMDKLWAYFKCSLDVHLENLLIDSSIPKPDHLPRNNIELPDAYWDNKLTPEEIFHELATHSSGSLTGFHSQLEEDYHQEVEKCLILGKVDELIDHLYEWSKTIQSKREERAKTQQQQPQSNFALFSTPFQSSNNKAKEEEEMAKVVEPNLLRFFAHLVITLRNLQLVVDEKNGELCVEILETYIGYLIEFKLVELVAFYTLYLPEHRQVKMFANLLEGIDDVELRPVSIMVAKQSKLNLPAILTLVVENIRTGNYSYQTKPAGSAPESQDKPSTLLKHTQLTLVTTEEDLRKISALDWLILDTENPQYVELLYQGNALIRSFLLERKLDPAIQTFHKLPSDIANLAFQECKRAQTTGDISISSIDIDNVMREYFGSKTFFEANESFQKWNHYLYNSKPREPSKPKTMTRLSDRVAYEQAVKQFEQEMEVWQQQIQTQAGITAEKLTAFLDFPGGIWINSDNFGFEDEMFDDDEVHSNLDSVSIVTPRLETMIEEANDDESINSDIEIQSADLRRTGQDNMVLKLQKERKLKDWAQRTVQLDGMRRIYVPQFVFLLYSVHADAGNLAECLRIADIVADENRHLHSCFTHDQIVDLLNKLREISIIILNQGVQDPLGYVGN